MPIVAISHWRQEPHVSVFLFFMSSVKWVAVMSLDVSRPPMTQLFASNKPMLWLCDFCLLMRPERKTVWQLSTYFYRFWFNLFAFSMESLFVPLDICFMLLPMKSPHFWIFLLHSEIFKQLNNRGNFSCEEFTSIKRWGHTFKRLSRLERNLWRFE